MFPPLKFESSVISYGNQTSSSLSHSSSEFESSVISYGNQTESVRSAVSAAV